LFFSSIEIVNARIGTGRDQRRTILTNWSDIMYQRVWLGVEGEMGLGDRFYAAAAIFGNRLISPVATVGSIRLTSLSRILLLCFGYLQGNTQIVLCPRPLA